MWSRFVVRRSFGGTCWNVYVRTGLILTKDQIVYWSDNLANCQRYVAENKGVLKYVK